MKKLLIPTLATALLLSSCNSYTGMGAYTGTQLGAILGSAIGGLSNGPRGSDLGTIVGMAGGAIIGAAIGNAVDQQNAQESDYQYQRAKRNYERKRAQRSQRQYDDYNNSSYNDNYNMSRNPSSVIDESNSGDDRIYNFDGKDYQSQITTQNSSTVLPHASSVDDYVENLTYQPNIEVRNARFIDNNQDGTISRGELCKVIFEVYNEGSQPIKDIQPIVIDAYKNKHLVISPSVHIEQILPGKGIRYTALIKADNRLKNGTAKICVSVLQGNTAISKVSEFNIPLRK